jgi:two-component system phosphate regulon sensor histidine kinase PhoR
MMQAYIIYDHFQSIEIALKRETDAILENAYHDELNIRRNIYKRDEQTNPKKYEKGEAINIDKVKNPKLDRSDYINLLNLAVEKYLGRNFPMSLDRVDSLATIELARRHIDSEFLVREINPKNESILKVSKKDFEPSIFAVESKLLSLDFEGKRSLQLVLTNPMRNIFSQMGYLLAGSLVLALICLYGLWFLFYTLAKQKQLLQVKNDFFGHTAHELKRPVAQLHMALDAISRTTIDENPLKKARYMAIMKEATQDMSEKIGMIMTLSMAEEGVFRLNYSNFDLIALIETLREKFTAVSDKTVSIQFEGAAEKMMIHADHDHIRQTIANLIDNAIKYSNDTVVVTISVTRQKGNLMLCVKDNGIGIAADKINSVFEKYTRINSAPGSPSGFGIGLSYVKAVIEKHAGRIEVSSELTKGSEFRVYLPE